MNSHQKRQLSALDQQFLAAEGGGVLAHVSWLAIYAPGSQLSVEDVRSRIASRLADLEPLRWRLARVPLALDWPYWEPARPDLSYHVRELTVQGRGDDLELARLIEPVVSAPLDRRRPLWELYVIGGLEGQRSALLYKLHHALVDGISQVDLIGALHDAPSREDHVDAFPIEDLATVAEKARWACRGLARYIPRMVRAIGSALPYLDQVPTLRPLPGVPAISEAIRRVTGRRFQNESGRTRRNPHPGRVHVARTGLNGRLSSRRQVAWAPVPFPQVRAVASRVTINDVLVATCAGALRSWLELTGQQSVDALVAMILKSRRAEHTTRYGNALSAFLTAIPTDVEGAAARLRRAHDLLVAAKEQHLLVPATILGDANNLVPTPMFRATARLLTRVASVRRREAPLHLVISNMQGPASPWFFRGVRLDRLYPLSALMPGAGLNITIVSYAGTIGYGVASDPSMVDPWEIAAALGAAHEDLVGTS